MSRPVLLVTSHAPADRAPLFAALHERESIELALFGGRSRHGGDSASELAVPHRHVAQRGVRRLAASGDFRAVIAGLGGRVALPGAYRGARRAGVPFVLWASLWAHPRSPAHALSYLPTRHLYRHADAVVTYGPHVSAYVRARGARNVHEARQAVDPAFWSAPAPAPVPRPAPFHVLYVGRLEKEKGVEVLLDAWRDPPADAALTLVGGGPLRPPGAVGPQSPEQVRNFLASSDVLVVPSIRTATFREPWGLVVNEAMHQRVAVIATTEVGAVAGGLVVHERTGLVVPAGDPTALRGAIDRLREDPSERAALAAAGREAVSGYTPQAWAAAFSAALTTPHSDREAC